MPNLEEHCARTRKRYRVESRDIHSWLDDPSRKYASVHRQFRHDTETVKLVGELFGKTYGKERAENIALDHIMADHEEEINNRNSNPTARILSPQPTPAQQYGALELHRPGDKALRAIAVFTAIFICAPGLVICAIMLQLFPALAFGIMGMYLFWYGMGGLPRSKTMDRYWNWREKSEEERRARKLRKQWGKK